MQKFSLLTALEVALQGVTSSKSSLQCAPGARTTHQDVHKVPPALAMRASLCLPGDTQALAKHYVVFFFPLPTLVIVPPRGVGGGGGAGRGMYPVNPTGGRLFMGGLVGPSLRGQGGRLTKI